MKLETVKRLLLEGNISPEHTIEFINELEKDRDEYREKYICNQHTVVNQQGTIKNLKSHISELESTVFNSEANLEHTLQQSQSALGENERLTLQNKVFEDLIEKNTEESENLLSTIQEQNEFIKSLQSSLTTKEKDIEFLSKVRVDQNDVIQSQQKEIEELEKQSLRQSQTIQGYQSKFYLKDTRIKELEEGLYKVRAEFVNIMNEDEDSDFSDIGYHAKEGISLVESLLTPKEEIGNPIQPQNPLDNAYEI